MKNFMENLEKRTELGTIPVDVSRALDSRDSGAFYRACLRYSYTPEGELQDDLYNRGSVEMDLDKKEETRYSNFNRDKVKDNIKLNKKPTKINYTIFLEELVSYGKISLDIFKHANTKREILRKSGYDVVYGKDGPISIGDASDQQIGLVFKKTYDQSQKHR